MKPAVLVTRRLPDKGMAPLFSRYSVTINPHDRVMSRQELMEGIEGKQALLSLLTDTVDSAVMDAAPGLRVISNYAVGFNNIDVKAATERRIVVTNTPGVLTETTADFAFALMLSIARRIPESERFLRAGRFQGWGPMLLLGEDIHRKTLGIVGMGRIGRAVAKRAAGFSMEVIYHSTKPLSAGEETMLSARYAPLDELLQASDFVTLHVPLTEKTRHLIGARELGLMRKDAFLINTSRGPIVDEEAVAEALASASIRGAALDVYEKEPQVHPGLLALENVILAPHTASATVKTRTLMAEIAAQNLIAAMEGERPPHVVNPEVLSPGR
ncbi:MAG: D-glycerate dehydrogenase [Candidatus Eremiobacteraeota bacterium]|nr:D-glycerate dehydrogenase [Candidatus Eremiobacteraeota bacterium]